MPNSTELLLELRNARSEYDHLCSGRRAQLTTDNPPAMTAAQLAALMRLASAEQTWKNRPESG
jgi:hypothetical protein